MAAAQMTAARAKSVRAINTDKRPLAAVAVYANAVAVCKAGYFQMASGDPDEIAVGYFTESVDNSAGAAGAKSANVKFPRERNLLLVDNDTVAPVVVAGREGPCSLLYAQTAQLYDTSKGAGATVYDVVSEGVWIEFTFPASPDDAGLPRIQKGTTTLIAGTKTVTGLVLTAGSIITMSMRDPGAGALTTFIGFDAPVASRAAGQFVINAIDNAKAVLITAVCTVDYQIIG